MPPYRIVEWEKHYETSETKRGKIKRMSWVAFTNKHDGEGLARLMAHKRRGVEYFGAFILMVEVASKCEPRGLLVRDDGTPHTPESLSAKTRAASQSFKSAIPKLIDAGWIEDLAGQEDAETSGAVRSRPENSAYPTLPDPTLPDPTLPDPTLPDPTVRGGKRRKWTDEILEQIYQAYPRKAAKQASLRETARALDLIAKRDGIEDPASWLLSRVKTYAVSPAGQAPTTPDDERRWYCRTFMKEGHYDDPESEWRRPNRGIAPKPRVQGREAAEGRRAEKARREYPEANPTL